MFNTYILIFYSINHSSLILTRKRVKSMEYFFVKTTTLLKNPRCILVGTNKINYKKNHWLAKEKKITHIYSYAQLTTYVF